LFFEEIKICERYLKIVPNSPGGLFWAQHFSKRKKLVKPKTINGKEIFRETGVCRI
jgi:hypothetical protein